jgi:hypothetical protein
MTSDRLESPLRLEEIRDHAPERPVVDRRRPGIAAAAVFKAPDGKPGQQERRDKTGDSARGEAWLAGATLSRPSAPVLSSRRMILPLAVLGRSSTISTTRGYL